MASSSKPLANGGQYTKCPSCNVVATDFIKSYLDLDGLAVDDVSISDDSVSDHEEIADECSDCGSIHGTPTDADADAGDNLDDGASAGSEQEFSQWLEDIGGRVPQPRNENPLRPRSQLSSTTGTSSSNNDIIILDSDDDENDNNTMTVSAALESSSSSFARPLLQFRKVSSSNSSNSNSNDTRKSPRPNAISEAKRRKKETKHANSSSTKDPDKLEKKYKLLKRKLAAMKSSMAEQQEKNKVHLEVKSEYEKLKQAMKDLNEKFVKEVYDSRHDKRELREWRTKADSLRKERDVLREERIKEIAIHNREKERLKDLTENAKASSMQEMILIISQNKDLRKQYHDIFEEWRSMSSQKKQTDKINASLKRQLDELSEEELIQNIEASKKMKPQSRTKTVELFRHGIKEAEDARILDEKESTRRQKEQELKGVVRKSSSQLGRVVTACNQKQKRKVRPSFLEKASVKKDSSRSLPASSVPSTFQPKPSIGTTKVIRKRPAGGDLRRMFKKI